MAILDIYTKIVNALENKDIACSVYLDFAKTFDTVNNNILISKLENYGRGIALNWFKSYLADRTQVVKINNVYSNELKITCGVPQRSVLGPLLFLIYINDIYRLSKLLKFHLFADDTSIFFSNRDPKTIEKTMNQELSCVSNWLNANKLSLNVSKSSFILFHPPQKKVNQTTLQIQNKTIPEKNHTKYLGVIMDKHLTWAEHINTIKIKLSKVLGILAKIRYSMPSMLLRTVYHAFFKPHIDYCINIWTCTTPSHLKPIKICMNKAVRIMTFSKPDEPANPLFKKLNLLNFENTVKLHIAKFMWEIENNNLPSCLTESLKLTPKSNSPRIIKNTDKYVPIHRTKYKSHFITTTGFLLWREMPHELKATKSKTLITSKLHKYLIAH